MRALIALPLAIVCLVACSGEKSLDTAGADPLVGRTYEIELGRGDVEGAEDLAATIELVLAAPVLTSITAEGGGGITMMLGIGVDGDLVTQNLCARTMEMPEGTFDGTRIEIGPEDVAFNANGQDYLLSDFTVIGNLSADGEKIEDMELSMGMDMSQAASFLGSDDGEAACEDFIVPLGLSCDACDDGSLSCIQINMTSIPAGRVPVDMQSVAESNAAEGCEG